jgi:cystathionine gamma-synthase
MGYDTKTRCIHGDNDGVLFDHPFGAVSTPIYQSATFAHPGVGETSGHNYSRESNPTRSELEAIVSSLEGATDTVATSSGMAAIALFLELFGRGDHLICSEDLYGGSVRLFDTNGKGHGLGFSYVNTADLRAVEAAILPTTRAIFVETPSNPTMVISDLEALSDLAHTHHLLLVTDNTFLSPYFCNPLRHGADVVIHSGTKFLAGHNDTLAGFLSVKDPELARRIRFQYKTTGSCLSPFDSFLVIRGIKTLAVRMERQQENALRIAQWLRLQPKVKRVLYVGLEDHPGREVHERQTTGYGSMISFEVDTAETAVRLLERVRLIAFAESLGGVESLITYPLLQTHGDVPTETRERLGITDRFLRLSIGIEDVGDLIRDLEQALQ